MLLPSAVPLSEQFSGPTWLEHAKAATEWCAMTMKRLWYEIGQLGAPQIMGWHRTELRMRDDGLLS